MGYRKTPKLLKLVMQLDEDEDLETADLLTITVKAMRLGEVKDFTEHYPTDGTKWDRVTHEQKEFISRVIEWNLEDEQGNPVPVSVDSMDSLLDPPDVKLILRTWLARCMGTNVENPLGLQSSNGETTDHTPNLEASLPMEPLSKESLEA